MQIESVNCPRDRRPAEAGVSPDVRLFVFAMQAAGFSFEKRDDGRFRVGPRDRVSEEQMLVLRGCFHEIRQLLDEERPL